MKRIAIVFSVMLMAAGAVSARELKLPQVPDSLYSPVDRAAYIIQHYWDAMDWCDTALTRNDKYMEQAAADFYSAMSLVDSLKASQAMATMLAGASADPDTYKRIAVISRDYLFDPQSQVADDEIFLALADRLLSDAKLGDADMLRLADSKAAAMLNRVGHKAADFDYVDRSGGVSSLYEALKLHPDNMLIFYDPDCHLCGELEQALMDTDLGDIGVIMISPFGEQDALWSQHAVTLPDDWIVGRPVDDDFEDQDIYELRAIPTILMIDGEGVVKSKVKFSDIPETIKFLKLCER